jgi:hypothetical protein
MKVFLMYRDRDFDWSVGELPRNESDLIQDLELDTLFAAMAREDEFLFEVAKRGLLRSLLRPEEILYRQQVFADCVANPEIVRGLYDLSVEAMVAQKKANYGFLRDRPESTLRRAVKVLEVFVGYLKRLREVAEEHSGKFESGGFTRMFAELVAELEDDYFALIEEHLRELKFKRGMLMSAELGTGNKGAGYVLRRVPPASWTDRIPVTGRSGLSFRIPDRDESGFKALGEIRERGVNLVANALAQSTDHILSYFAMLRAELGFYLGCLNLRDRLEEKGEPICAPAPLNHETTALQATGLYDACLSLSIDKSVVGNDVDASNKSLVMITGANQGGKSTFLRSVGVAQLMMQSGMFAPAEAFRANVCDGLFTHYKREEDSTMESGKLDEELARMAEISEQIKPESMLLCNESFAATNEREGSEIARQVVRAFTETGVKVFFVTHMYDLAHSFYARQLDSALFLRAERHEDGGRTFRLSENEPLPTSYGADSYQRVFGAEARPPAAAADAV